MSTPRARAELLTLVGEAYAATADARTFPDRTTRGRMAAGDLRGRIDGIADDRLHNEVVDLLDGLKKPGREAKEAIPTNVKQVTRRSIEGR